MIIQQENGTVTNISTENEIAWISGSNPAGVFAIQCMPLALASGSVQEAYFHDLLLTLADPWLYIYFTQNTKSYTETEAQTDHGNSYEVSASGFFPGDSDLVRGRVDIMRRHRWIIRVTDNAGVQRQAGDAFQGLDLVANFTIDAQMSGDRGYRFEFRGFLTKRPAAV